MKNDSLQNGGKIRFLGVPKTNHGPERGTAHRGFAITCAMQYRVKGVGEMDNKNNEMVWTAIPKLQRMPSQQWEEALDNSLLQIVLAVVQDGICILNAELDILYSNVAMKTWYKHKGDDLGHKCYEIYHDRTEPCEGCSVLKAIKSRQPETMIQYYSVMRGKKEWHRLFSVPIFDYDGNVYMVIEYVRNITNEKKSDSEKRMVESQNKLLLELTDRQEKESREREKSMTDNVSRAVKVVLGYLEDILDKESYTLVQHQLDIGLKGMPAQVNPMLARLSNKELMIAGYIRDGYMSKEIADKLCVSKKTVDYHRTNIRKKLELGENDGLQAYLKEHLKSI